MKQFLAQLKEYWFLIVFAMGLLSAIWGLAMGAYVMSVVKSEDARLYLEAMIDAKLASADFPSDATVAEINGALQLHGAEIGHNKENIALTREQLQDVAEILMRPPE